LQQQPSPEQLAYRIASIEEQLRNIQTQMHQYELARENDLKFQNMRAEVERLARDQAEIKAEQTKINARIVEQQAESERRDSAQRESQAALQIKVLAGVVTTVIGALVAILVGYITHIFH
jgi:peptidoglycan hydrolase CwlO-like protein